MATEEAIRFYKSKAWKECRKAYAKSARGLCESCLSKGLYVPGEIVHHINHISADNVHDPEILLNWDNLRLVCRKCHAEEHEAQYLAMRRGRYWWDKHGQLHEKAVKEENMPPHCSKK